MMTDTLNLLVIENVKADFLLIERHLRQHIPTVRCRRVTSHTELTAALDEGGWDVVLLRYTVPGMDFHEALALIHAHLSDLPVILLVSDSVGQEAAVELLKDGVWHFVSKDTLFRLVPAIERSLEEAAKRRARQAAEKGLREREEHYRSLFDNMLNGFAYCRMLFDRDRPKDFTYLKVNSAFEALTGLRNVIGKKVSEVIPGIGASDPELFEIYGRVALTGKPERFETYVEALGMWFSISVYSPRREYFVAVFDVITERKRAEAALRESEDKYHKLFEEATEGIVLTDAETGEILDCNRAFSELTGYDRPELIGMPRTLLHLGEEGAPRVSDSVAQHRSEKNGEVVSTELLTKSGMVKKVEIKFNVLAISGRKVVREFFRDVTEESRYRSERETTLRLLRLLNEQSNTQELIGNLTGFLQEWTGCEAVGVRLRDRDDFPYFETRGFPPAFVKAENSLCARDAVGRPLRDSQGKPLLECLCGNILGGRFNPALSFFTPKGSFWTNSTTDFLTGATEADRQAHVCNRCNAQGYESMALVALRHRGHTLGLLQLNDPVRNRFTPEMITFLENLSDQIAMALAQRQAQAALQVSEQRFRDISEAAGEFIWELDPHGRFTYCSDRVEAVLGYRPEELIGRRPFELEFMEAAETERSEAFWSEHVQAKEGFREFESCVILRSGSPVWLSTTGVPIMSPTDELLGFRGASLDITERKQAEERIKAQSERLREANAALKVLLKQREQDRAELEESLLDNVKHLVLPYMEKLKKSRLGDDQKLYLEILETHLKEVTSPFVHKLSAHFLGLTPTEIRVSELVRQGRTSKEIAELLGTSERAVLFHRQHIREKLGLKQRKINLQSYLTTLS